MILYRICKSDYKDDLSGYGAKLNGARWNSKGTVMLYTAEYISLAVLEMLVHINFTEVPISFHLLSISIPDNAGIGELKPGKLKTSWTDDNSYTAYIGDEFIQSKEMLCLKVPSAVVSDEHNYLLNPLHTDYKKVQISSARQFKFDKRLFYI
jgi:RES domain-containing protein